MKLPPHRLLAAGLLAACTALAAQPSAPTPGLPLAPLAAISVNTQPVHTYTLSNGMTLIVKPDRRAPTAVHMVWVRVGAMDETDGRSGLAHVLEHMMFKGTAQLRPGEFSRRVAALGGNDNAFTASDFTGYHQQIPADRLEDVMRLEADRFVHNQWSDDEFRRELEVVKEERRLRVDDSPRARLFETLNAVTFLASPYRRPIVGWMSDLDSLKPEDARAFYRAWYVPANAAVVVAGDVDPATVHRLAERHYGRIPARPVPERKPREEPPQRGLRSVEVKAPADQAYTALQFKVPQLRNFEATPENDDALALTVLAGVLDGHPAARLDRGLTQGTDRVADSVNAGNGLWGRGPQLFTLDGVPAPGKTVQQVQQGLRAEVERVAREGVTEAELQRVKTGWTAAQIYKLDSLFNQARELGSYWALGLPLDAGERLIARLNAVSAPQVQAVAQRYFGDDQLTIGTLRPLPRSAEAPAAPRRAPQPEGVLH